MKNKTFFITWTLVISLSWFSQSQTVTHYKPVSVNYVNLSDGTTVTAQPIQTKRLKIKPSKTKDASVVIRLNDIIHPNLSGIGGAFNEQGGEAFMSLKAAQQYKLAAELFNADKGIGLSHCRTAIGSSDFGLGAYSYSETPDDFEMKHFSVARDETSVIPFIKAAYVENPNLKIFASPWSPPGWMKITGKMDGGNENPENNTLIANSKIYNAYALYFSKYIQEYSKHGVQVDRLIIQNETDMNPTYPGCDMSPQQMAELAFDYIRPTFKSAELKTELWAGSFRGKRKDASAFMALKGAEKIDGVGLQYCSSKAIKALNKNYPEMNFMHTEGKCWNGKNTMKQARSRFNEVCMWINSGCENYCYWNMVLNEESKSAWGWKQNSMIKIDRQTQTITYNADYAPMALFSKFVRPGDQSIKTTTPDNVDALAVRNKKHVVVFLENDTEIIETQQIKLASKNYTVQLPANSLCAFVFEPKK
ncbi:glycoside hydrolase family 30 protein [Flavivirga jejuensis]|uniref:Glycosyl hydrolase family 30 TIM-barrel domain-containing protein n=1 Tax=Flavivirga jejuensis TaxID=870487 RepID=A0ABT8WSP8_9FLAO|nr:hypothetical protein [Flavivirga jejuensis]MDO5976193.1 hypothetical protein [Flavivirga jejuensis]